MRILVIGAGPAGLAFAALMARTDGAHDITVIERNPAGADPGWGVTLRNYALGFLGLSEQESMQKLRGRACWYGGDVAVDLPYPEHDGLHTIARRDLQRALAAGAERSGARITYATDARALTPADLDGYDLVVAADGRGSAVRTMFADEFGAQIALGRNWYTWLGSTRPFDTLTILLEDRDIPLLGWSYKYTPDRSTFIVEASASVLAEAGLAEQPADEASAAIARAFERPLDGAEVLHTGTLRWEQFPMLSCARLSHGNVVLIGDAAHTTHFSQGFGTMFAFDDAEALHEAITASADLPEALERYEAVQQPKIANFQTLSGDSMRWSEGMVDALTARDDSAIRAQIELRWPNNEMPQAPMRRADA